MRRLALPIAMLLAAGCAAEVVPASTPVVTATVRPSPSPTAAGSPGPDVIVRPASAAGPQTSTRPFGRLLIPKISLDTPVYEGVDELVNFGPLHWYGTPDPGGRGNTVFSAHRTTHTHPFRRIDELQVGDRITYKTAGTFTYFVLRSFVVKASDLVVIEQGDDSIATIFACHPPGNSDHWYVVQARLANTPTPGPSVSPTPAATPQATPARTPFRIPIG